VADSLIARLGAWLDGYETHSRSSFELYGSGPVVGSLAAVEISSSEAQALSPEWNQHLVFDAFGMSIFRLHAAADHLHTLSLALGPPPMVFSVFTLARAVLEIGARAWWLLDPTIGARERAARHLTENLYSFWETAQLGDQMADGGTPQDRIARTIEWAEQNAFTVKSAKGRATSIDEARPSATSLMDQMLPDLGPAAFKGWSAVAHVTTGGMVSAFNFTTSDDGTGSDPSIRSDAIANVIFTVLFAYEKAFGRAVEVLGWDTSVWLGWSTKIKGEMIEMHHAIASLEPD
jgi:hypothetical protein